MKDKYKVSAIISVVLLVLAVLDCWASVKKWRLHCQEERAMFADEFE